MRQKNSLEIINEKSGINTEDVSELFSEFKVVFKEQFPVGLPTKRSPPSRSADHEILIYHEAKIPY